MLPKAISTPSVNKRTARSLIAALLKSNGITRGELARACGVSAMTAGKIVSAMRDAKYATADGEIGPHSRVSELIYPSERFTFLIFDIGSRTMSADIYDARENTLFTYTQPRNHGVDVTSDVNSFVSLVNEQIGDIGECDDYRLSALIYQKSISLDSSAINLGEGAIFVECTSAATSYVNARFPTECIAFVGANGGDDIAIVSSGRLIGGKNAPHANGAHKITSELEMLDALTARLSDLFSFIIPDRVVIDSRSLHLSRRFSDELSERLSERTAIQKEELPELVTNDGIPFPSRAAIEQLIDIYAELISAN